ncbi:hypothetical protein BGZ99_008413 [Dissophora globulifera]|uniref:Adenylate cyclase-associated CAP C-terminal domain-containing protein n=1 Tax=Dissophora globulifera TaxID=979702 RepID=A0A9P6RRA5_9FUNG|nr:hypothetical protein BGZ99_008413 [Dissophora globulifera]
MSSVKDQINALNATLAGRKNAKEDATLLIQNSKDAASETLDIQERKAIHLLNCENCEYIIQGKPIKLSIERCKNVVIKIEGKILTGTVDVWKSNDISLDFERSVSMFQLDSIQNITIRLPDAEHFGSMIWAGVDDLKLHLGEDMHLLSYSELQTRNPGLRPESDQFKTTVIDGSLKTEAIIRFDQGYPSTRAERATYQQLEKKKDEVLRTVSNQED